MSTSRLRARLDRLARDLERQQQEDESPTPVSRKRLPMAEEMLTQKQVAEFLSTSPRNITTRWKLGEMPSGVKIGNLRRWPKSVILAWIAAGCPKVERRA